VCRRYLWFLKIEKMKQRMDAATLCKVFFFIFAKKILALPAWQFPAEAVWKNHCMPTSRSDFVRNKCSKIHFYLNWYINEECFFKFYMLKKFGRYICRIILNKYFSKARDLNFIDRAQVIPMLWSLWRVNCSKQRFFLGPNSFETNW
jgi:hypothetical protein